MVPEHARELSTGSLRHILAFPTLTSHNLHFSYSSNLLSLTPVRSLYETVCFEQLFRNAGVSQRLYDDFLEPMLLVLPMCPGEDCSAAAALSCFQYFALEHQVCI